MTKDEAEKFVTQAEAARLRGVTRAAIAGLIKRGRLRTKELYGVAFVYREDIENFERAKPTRKASKKKASKRAAKKKGKNTPQGKR